MRRVTLQIPLPDPVHGALRALWRASRGRRAFVADLTGDRDVEWTWVAARIPSGSGEALDFGCGGSALGLLAAQRGFCVTAVDLEGVVWPYQHERLSFLRGDILHLPLRDERYDLVINCSAVEHVGLPGRYGITRAQSEGDLLAMARMRALLKRGGTMLLTVPAGRDAVFPPWHRVYGPGRLPRLLEGFNLEHGEYWIKDRANRWAASDEATVLSTVPREGLYGLGCFVLRRP